MHQLLAFSRSILSQGGMPFFVVLAVLSGAGLGQRLLEKRIAKALGKSLQSAQPLAALSMEIGEWRGYEVPVPEDIQRIAAEDDFISRRYHSDTLGQSIELYMGYIGRARAGLWHRPDICYAAHGWEPIPEEQLTVETRAGRGIPCMLYEFRSPEIGGPRVLVLATYLMNGKYIRSVDELGAYNRREAPLFTYADSYIARVQISLEASGSRQLDLKMLAMFASQVLEHIESLMPYISE